MAAAQQLVQRVLKVQCQALEERYAGYQVDVVRRIAAVLQLERQGQSTQKIAEELQDFGDTLGRKTGGAEEEEAEGGLP